MIRYTTQTGIKFSSIFRSIKHPQSQTQSIKAIKKTKSGIIKIKQEERLVMENLRNYQFGAKARAGLLRVPVPFV